MKLFPPHCTDFYKTGHIRQYPEKTEFVYSNWTCRSDKFADVLPDYDHKVVFFGLQGVCQWLLKDTWDREFFRKPKEKVLLKYKKRMDGALGPGAVLTEHIEALWELGYLPVLIKAVPEGSRVNIRVPMWIIQNTLPEFFWVTNYLETQLSSELWHPLTSATVAFEYRRLLIKYAHMTGAPLDFVQWQGHDFSFRGMTGIHAAAQSGAAHLLSFTGTDTIPGIDYLSDYYSGDETFVGGSVPATEHSVMCMGAEGGEIETFARLINHVYPSGIVSIVSDTWDFWRVITDYASTLKADIISRRDDALGNAKVVFRPDSGDPVKIIVGDPEAPFDSPERKGAVQCLWEIFGGTKTSTGYRTLDRHVGLIYGDSISLDRASKILSGLESKGFSSANIVFGIGSYTYQHVTRDTFGTAIKATFGVVNGQDRVLFKKPKTDSGEKNSAKGLLRVEKEGNDFILYENQTREQEEKGEMKPVFMNGQMMRHEKLDEIRQRLLS